MLLLLPSECVCRALLLHRKVFALFDMPACLQITESLARIRADSTRALQLPSTFQRSFSTIFKASNISKSLLNLQNSTQSNSFTTTAMPKDEYPLLVDEFIYADMVLKGYDASKWMSLQPIPAKSMELLRSKKKLGELCRKGAIRVDDTWTMKKTDSNGITVTFSATVGRQSSVLPGRANVGYRCFTDPRI